MRKSNCCYWILVLQLVGRAPLLGAGSGQTATEQRCGANLRLQPQRSFADVEGKNDWKEFESAAAVPQLSTDGGEVAGLWKGSDGKLLVHTEAPGEDFAAYSDYCFDAKEKLVQLRFELRTAWGWGYRQEGPIRHGVFRPRVAEFFDTHNELAIPRPMQASDIPEALKAKLYFRMSQLPFFKALSK